MNKNQVVPAFLLVLVTFGLSQTNGNLYGSRPNLNDTFIDKVDRLFAPWSEGDTPGAAVIVVKDSQVLLKKGYGLANLENKKPIEPDTTFLLGSITKQFTAMAIMMLAERGNLRYENPLTRWKLLPESEAKFFLEGREEMSLIFNNDEKGNVIGIISSLISARKL
jgi:CubicO group peptidase (beta-lactamase class C family)